MDQSETRRERLAQLLDLAQNYKSWTRKELARTLGRDPTKLIPGSGVPKLDLVVDLAQVLDWAIDDVVSYLWGSGPKEIDSGLPDDFETVDGLAREAHAQGAYHRMIELAKHAYRIATTAEQRARACNREVGGWDGLGRYTRVLGAAQRGLRQEPVSGEFRRLLQANLGNAYYSLWSLVESGAIARDLLAWYEDNPPQSVRDRKAEAFAHYVCGHTYRRLMRKDPERSVEFARRARAELTTARDRMCTLADALDADAFRGIANTCDGGLIEIDVELGDRNVTEALAVIGDGLEAVGESAFEGDDAPVGDWLESYGWWCIFGCNIALRHLTDEREVQSHMAVFTNKADEIAEKLDNWSIRERVFTMEHSRWERAVGCTGFDIPRVVDDEDVRVITGTMARFPNFQATGWQILRSARVVRSS